MTVALLADNTVVETTFIEPNYGIEPLLGLEGPTTNAGGSSQHPVDDMYGGEGLNQGGVRDDPHVSTVGFQHLIITYDEHGGFYDSATPPGERDGVVPPGDDTEQSQWNTEHLDFKQYGV